MVCLVGADSLLHNRCHRCHTVELCVLCRWVSQTCMSYPSMSGYICGGECAVLFMTRHRLMTADKWIRSVTVTVASGKLCVWVFVGQNEVSVHHDAALTFDTMHTETHVHFFSLPVSANTTLIWIVLHLESNHPPGTNTQYFKFIWKSHTSSSSALISPQHWTWWYFALICCSERSYYSNKLLLEDYSVFILNKIFFLWQ